jgi:hypothetical protein
MVTKDGNWNLLAKGLLKAEMAKRDFTFAQLTELLGRVGIRETPENVTNKVNRGRFSAAFFLQCLKAMNCKVLRLTDE